MGRKVTLNLDADTRERLSELAGALGCSDELAAIYAVRLVSACVREGLLEDMPGAWPQEACLPGLFDTGTGGKVLAFRTAKRDEE